MKRKTREEEYREYAKSYVAQPTYIPPFQSGWMPIRQISAEKGELTTKPNPFDPQNFNDFVGQESAKEVLAIIVDSANKEKRLIPNILLTGAYGHGKTTLARLIIKRHKKQIRIVDGSVAALSIEPSKDIVYIVDEAHNIPPQLADTYNVLLDSGDLRLIACTTKPGALPAAFRSRFRNIYITNYTAENIKTIIQKAAKRAKIRISPRATRYLGERSKFNPRYALNLLDFLREIKVLYSSPEETIKEGDVIEGLAKLKIDSLGLTELDRKYLGLLRYDRAIGVQYIASILYMDIETIQEEVEPYLIQIGLVERTPRGRIMGSQHTIERLKRQILEEAKNFAP